MSELLCELRLAGGTCPPYDRPQYRAWFDAGHDGDCERRQRSWQKLCPHAQVQMRQMNPFQDFYTETVACGSCQTWPQVHGTARQARLPGRVLMIVMGSLRGTIRSWESLLQLVLRPLDATLMLVLAEPLIALMSGTLHSTSPAAFDARRFNTTFGHYASHVVSVPEFMDWGTALDNMEREGSSTPPGKSWRSRVACPSLSSDTSPLGGVTGALCRQADGTKRPLRSTGSAAIVGVYRYYAKRAIVDKGLLTQHEWFIACRTDIIVLCGLRLPAQDWLEQVSKRQMRTAFVPLGEDWGGVYDRFIIASRHAIVPALTTLESWVRDRAELRSNPERQLSDSLADGCVHVLRVPRTVLVVQSTSNDTKRSRSDRSHHGHCMGSASETDARRFSIPHDWAGPTQWMQRTHMCPKYAAAMWITEHTCGKL